MLKYIVDNNRGVNDIINYDWTCIDLRGLNVTIKFYKGGIA